VRTVCWFSCGAPSAVAAKIALEADSAAIVAYCDTGSEHPDNERFLRDVEKWLGIKVTRLKSEKYANTWEVFEQRRYLVGPKGALCTTELKKVLRFDFQRADDRQVFGYTAEEASRADRFREQNFDVDLARWSEILGGA
jgi:3'-phosphoadenosine 5'-phosphosulfate sulfotransferase (PAPS reductase)/FAD synthetase